MNAIFEFFICPVHGIFRPDNWSMIAPAFAGAIVAVRHLWSCVTMFVRKF
jgi:hypothetical protein